MNSTSYLASHPATTRYDYQPGFGAGSFFLIVLLLLFVVSVMGLATDPED